MSAFVTASEVETEAMKDIVPFIASQSTNGRFVLTNKGRLSKELQKKYGDAFSETEAGIISVEFKAERENGHGNFFLETWSNRHWFTLGWMYTLDADMLLYYFLAERQMYSIPFPKLRKWAFHENRIYSFPEKQQNKYVQMNDTWGRCVPITVVRNEVGLRQYQFSGSHGTYERVLT